MNEHLTNWFAEPNNFKKLCVYRSCVVLLTSQEVGHVLQLWYVVLSVAAVLGEQRQVVEVLFTGMCRVQLIELPKHYTPRLHLFLCELHAWYGISTAEGERSMSILRIYKYL